MAAPPPPPTRSTGLGPGARLPDFARTAADGRVLYFYEFANGRPLLFAACGSAAGKGEVDGLIDAARALAADIGMQAIVLCDEGAVDAASDLDVAVLVDPDPQLRDYIFGTAEGHELVMLAIADPNLRLIARSALAASAPAADLAAALRGAAVEALARWQAERDALGGLAPVLLVPRVLAPDLCRRLIAGFPGWLPRDSPMPDAAQPALAVDLARKRRLDALIGDPALEAETVAAIAAHVVPEVAKAFCFDAVRFERLKIVCYRAGDGGHFATHRDNTAPQTAYRRFALTVNLNTGEYAGGTLAFPEYGEGHGYAVPAGGAIVFACTHAHRVDPVTAGERYALISFLSGT
jgi:hypothetical protein